MRILRIAALAAAAALLSVPASAAEHKLRPGQYEIKSEMKMEGFDQRLPPTTLTHCYTEEDVKDYRKLAQSGRNQDCDVADVKAAGSHVSWTMTCKSGSKGTGEMEFSADGYDMTLHLETPGGPHGPMKMKIVTAAKRLGDCSS